MNTIKGISVFFSANDLEDLSPLHICRDYYKYILVAVVLAKKQKPLPFKYKVTGIMNNISSDFCSAMTYI